jgi:hypothetical protein
MREVVEASLIKTLDKEEALTTTKVAAKMLPNIDPLIQTKNRDLNNKLATLGV